MKMFHKLDQNRKLILFIIFLFSFVLRVSLTYQDFSRKGMTNWMDAKEYLSFGLSFAQGDFYPELGSRGFISSGAVVPLIVALMQTTTGNPVNSVLLFNCLLSALLVFVLFALGRTLINVTAGYIMAIWSVFNFAFIRMNFQILKEPLILILLPLIILCLINIYRKKKILINTVISSLLFSLLIHIDERYLSYLIFFVPFIFVVSLKPHKIKLTALWLLIIIISMIPWTIRNYREFNEIVILTARTTAFTSKLWGTNFGAQHFSSEKMQEMRIESRREGAEFVGEQYGRIPRRYGRYEKYWVAFYHYWKPTYFRLTFQYLGYTPQKWSLSHNLNGLVFYGIFLPFYFLGIAFSIIRKNWIIVFLAAIPVFHSIMHTIMIWPIERYRLPMDFLVVVVALWFFYTYILKSGNVLLNQKVE